MSKTAKAAPDQAGDIWTWTAIDADTKLIPSWLVGSRDAYAAQAFIGDLAMRLANRVQLTSDGHRPYLEAVEQSFGADIDYAMLIKITASRLARSAATARRMHRRREAPREGNPDPEHISTSYVERSNLTMRMHARRFTRLTNAFSKKAENHAHAVALHLMHYNFVRIHGSLRCSPAMAAGVTTKLWDVVVVRMIEGWEAEQEKRAA